MTGVELSANSRWTLVSSLMHALKNTNDGLGAVPGLVKEVLKSGAWREFPPPIGAPAKHERFEEFVTAPGPRGLGASLDLVERLIADDPEALVAYRKETTGPVGTHRPQADSNNVTISAPVRGNSTAYNLERMQREYPQLYADVIAKRVDQSTAMQIVGYVKPQTTVQLHDMRSTARTLCKKLTSLQIYELATLLFEALREDDDEDVVEDAAPVQKQNGTAPPKRTATARAPGSKLTDDEVREIRRLAEQGVMRTVIARRLGIGRSAAGDVARRKSYAHVPDDPDDPTVPAENDD